MGRLAVALATGLIAAAPAAQDAPQPPLRTSTLTVEVDVTVHDRQGGLVTDLRAEDFEVLEGGVLQKIDTVFLVTASPSTGTAAAALTPEPPVPVVAAPGRVFVFYFDTHHIGSPGALDRARDALRTFLQAQFRPGDVGGIVADGRMLDNRLTSKAEELIAAAASVKPTSSMREKLLAFREWPRIRDELEALRIERNDREALAAAVTRACAEDATGCQNAELMLREKAGRLANAFRLTAAQTLRSTDALVNGLGRIPGRKTVVLFSDGFVVEGDFQPLATAVGRAGRHGVRFYTVDTRGLNRGADGIDSPLADDPAGAPPRFDMQGDATNSLAVDTGGLAIRNENNFGRALDSIARDTGTYYVIGYSPMRQELDGTFRRVTVRVKRDGVRIRARAGYLAVAPATPPPSAPGREPATETPPPPLPALPELTSISSAALSASVATAIPTSRALERVESVARGEAEGVRVAPTAADARAKDGWSRYAKGDVEGARDLLAAAAGADAPVWVHYALGHAEFALRRYDAAITAWAAVRDRAPALREVYLDLADAYLQSGAVTNALGTVRDAAKRWPTDPEFQNAIGVLHVRRNALDEAIQAFSTAAALAPEEPLAYFNLGRAYEMRFARGTRYASSLRRWIVPEGDRRKAAEHYRRYLELGGPYDQQAREALLRLEWSPRGGGESPP